MRRLGGLAGIGQGAIGKFVVAAAHEGEHRPVVAEGEAGELDAVIPGESGERLARGAGASDPDVAHAGFVLDPGEARDVASAGQATGDRQREMGGEIVATLRRQRGRGEQQCRQTEDRQASGEGRCGALDHAAMLGTRDTREQAPMSAPCAPVMPAPTL